MLVISLSSINTQTLHWVILILLKNNEVLVHFQTLQLEREQEKNIYVFFKQIDKVNSLVFDSESWEKKS